MYGDMIVVFLAKDYSSNKSKGLVMKKYAILFVSFLFCVQLAMHTEARAKTMPKISEKAEDLLILATKLEISRYLGTPSILFGTRIAV